MATRKELMEKITELTSEYLGFRVAGVAGLSGKNKKELEQMVNQLTKAVRFKRYSNKIQVDALTGYFSAKGTPARIAWERKTLIRRVADELWFNQPYASAKQKARNYQGS